VCDLETSRIGAPYIYDISSLRVNNLTLILLTWKKWWAPNNASKQQMGFNSAFKALMHLHTKRGHITQAESWEEYLGREEWRKASEQTAERYTFRRFI